MRFAGGSTTTPFTIIQVLNAARDVTAESEQAAALKRLNAFQQAVIATAPDLIIVVHVATGRVTWTSRPLSSLLGWSDADIAELGDRPLEAIAHWDDVGELRRAFDAASAAGDGELTHVRYRTRTAHKPWRWLSLSMTAFEHAANGAVTSVLATARDVTELVESEGQLAHAALHDPLTGLPNRRLIADRLDTAVAGLARGGAVGVLFIDLDGFKRINDGFGHAAGDAVLKETADRLCLAVRPADTVGRVGGDEFVVVAPSLPAAHAHPIAAQLAERIRRDLAVPIVWEAQQHQVTASVGIVLAEPGSDSQSLLRDADSAMYVAKRHGKDTIAEFDPILREQAIRRSTIEQAIRRALATSTVEVFYQPIVRLTDKAITSVEALLRIRDEAGNYLDTSQVIEVAEATGLITDIGPEVMRIATQQLQTTPGIPRVAVNLSAREIARTDFYARVRGNLDAVGLPPDRLALELTETVLLEAPHATLRDLERLREDGIAIAIDDFGTGFASLRYLTTLPVTAIKIDRSFTSGLGYDHVNESIVAACLWLTNELDIECIVEGIETSLQLEHLAPGAHVYAQGYYLGAPAPSGQPPTEG